MHPNEYKIVWASVQNVLECKYITLTVIEVVWDSVQNILACKYIATMGMEVVWVSYWTFLHLNTLYLWVSKWCWWVCRTLSYKYIAPTGTEIVLVVGQIVPCKNFPHRLQIWEYRKPSIITVELFVTTAQLAWANFGYPGKNWCPQWV